MIILDNLKKYMVVRKAFTPNSVRHCLSRAKVLDKWLSGRELTKPLVEDFFYHLKEKGLNNNSLNTYLFTLRTLRDYQKDRGEYNGFLEGFESFPKHKPLIVILTPEEIEKIIGTQMNYISRNGVNISSLDYIYRTFIMFLAFTGCRFSEAADLKIKYLDLSAGKATFVLTKNKEYRFSHINEPLLSRLKELVKNRPSEDLVFHNSLKQKLQPQTFSFDLRKRAIKAGVTKRVHPHIFRHSFATQLLMSGVDLTMVAALLGHKDIQTTYENYVHLADESLKKATYRHPLIRKNIPACEIIQMISDIVKNFRIDQDERFAYKLDQGNSSLSFNLFLR